MRNRRNCFSLKRIIFERFILNWILTSVWESPLWNLLNTVPPELVNQLICKVIFQTIWVFYFQVEVAVVVVATMTSSNWPRTISRSLCSSPTICGLLSSLLRGAAIARWRIFNCTQNIFNQKYRQLVLIFHCVWEVHGGSPLLLKSFINVSKPYHYQVVAFSLRLHNQELSTCNVKILFCLLLHSRFDASLSQHW